eukprot:gene3295-3571_t
MIELEDEVKPKLLKQVEFYFSDSNLPKDKFLRGQVEAHPEGYVDMSLIVSFARMRELLKVFQAAAAAAAACIGPPQQDEA